MKHICSCPVEKTCCWLSFATLLNGKIMYLTDVLMGVMMRVQRTGQRSPVFTKTRARTASAAAARQAPEAAAATAVHPIRQATGIQSA